MKRVTYYVGLGGVSKSAIERVQSELASVFNGFTWTPATGSWLSPSGELVGEDSATVTVLTEANNWAIANVANFTRQALGQTEVWYTIEPIKVHVSLT